MSWLSETLGNIFNPFDDLLEPSENQPGVGDGVGGVGGGSFTPDAFNQLITDSSSFSVTLDSGTRNAIQWITAKDRILIGTADAEWRMSGHSNKPLTPSNFDLKKQTVWGSKDMQPLVLHEAVLFVDSVGRKLREMVWDGIDERYLSPDLMLLAEHITLSGGITTMAYQKNPDSIIWATLANGDLISCTYDKSQKVVAWARHPLPIGSEAGTTIPSTNTFIPVGLEDYPELRATSDQDDPQLPHIIAISNVEDLQNMNSDKSGNYYLTQDIVADTITWNGGAGFIPIGTSITPFTGTFDGQGFTIDSLFIERATDDQGLFGEITVPAKIANVTLTNVDIKADDTVGALAGYLDAYNVAGEILIQNCHATGIIKGHGGGNPNLSYAGGLIGRVRGRNATDRAKIYDCSSTCEVNMEDYGTLGQSVHVGGFVGQIDDSTVSNCFATGNIIGTDTSATRIGGFVGYVGGGASADTSEIDYCYATGSVIGEENIGGFVGLHTGLGFIRKCYATGNVTASGTDPDDIGGFSGGMEDTAETTDCYARGSVTMEDSGSVTGGFAATVVANNTIANCYSIGEISSSGLLVGGFSGNNGSGNQTSTYWDIETSGEATSSGNEVSKTTTLMKTQSTFTDWDFEDIWIMPNAIPWLDTSNSNNMGANSVAVIPGETEDEVWITVTRAIDGNLVRYVERMKPRNFGTDRKDAFFVDSGLTYNGEATSNFTGLEHLEGEEVAILGDGMVFPTQIVTNGTLPNDLDQTVTKAHIGLPYTYKVKPMRMDQATARGTSKGSIKKIYSVVVSFYKTMNAKYGNGKITSEFKFPPFETYSTPAELYTGDVDATLDGGFSVEDPIEITGSDPLPCTVRAIIPRLDVTGK